jgi:hypothetical protein
LTPETSNREEKAPNTVGSGLRSCVGLVAFLAGGLGALAFVGPSLFAPTFARAVEDAYAKLCLGSLEIGGAHLAWTGRGELSDGVLRDPRGEEVVRFTLGLPSLQTLDQVAHPGSGSWSWLGRYDLSFEALVRRGPGGRTNLEEAIALRDDFELEAFLETEVDRDTLSLGTLLSKYAYVLLVTNSRIGFEDEQGGLTELKNVRGTFEVRAERRRLDLRFDRPGRPGEELSLEVVLEAPTQDGMPWRLTTLDVDVRDVPAGLVDALFGAGGLIEDVVGARFDLRVAPVANGLDVALDSDLARARVGVRERNEQVVMDGASIDLPASAWVRFLEPAVPDPFALSTDAPNARWTLAVNELRLPKRDLFGLLRLGPLRGSGCDELTFDANLEGGALSLRSSEGTLAIHDLAAGAELLPDAACTLWFDGDFENDGEAGSLNARFHTYSGTSGLVAQLAGSTDPTISRRDVRITGSRVPTALLAPALPFSEVWVDVFGPVLDEVLIGPARIEVASDDASLAVDGVQEGEVFRVQSRDGFRFDAARGEAVRAAILEPLLAPLVGPDTGERLRLSSSALELPLDENAHARGTLGVEIGKVRARGLLGLGEPREEASMEATIAPFEVELDGPYAILDGLTLDVGELELGYSGRVDLERRTVVLETLLPLLDIDMTLTDDERQRLQRNLDAANVLVRIEGALGDAPARLPDRAALEAIGVWSDDFGGRIVDALRRRFGVSKAE